MTYLYVGYGPGPTEEETAAAALAEATRAARETQIRADVTSGLEVNRLLGEQNQAILDAAQTILVDRTIADYQPGSKSPTEILADVLAGLKALDVQVKQAVAGIQILAEHDQVALEQRNYLARLALADYSGTD